MAAKKKSSVDTRESQKTASLKKAGAFYSGKQGGGSADTMAARGKSRVSSTAKTLASEGPKRKPTGSGVPGKRNASEGPKRRDMRATATSRTGSEGPKRTSSRAANVGGAAAALGIVGAAGAAGRAVGRAAGRQAYRPNNAPIRSASGQVVARMGEPTAASARVAATGRDAWGQSMPRSTSRSTIQLGTGGFGSIRGGGGGRLFGR